MKLRTLHTLAALFALAVIVAALVAAPTGGAAARAAANSPAGMVHTLAAAKCAHQLAVVSINGALPGVSKPGPCWKGLIRLHATGNGRCALGTKPTAFAFDEVSAARSEFVPRGRLARACAKLARKRAKCPRTGPCGAVGIALYGYDQNFSPAWGLSAPVPGFGVRLLELYDGVAEAAVVPAAEAGWRNLRNRYGAIIEVGGSDDKAVLAAGVLRVCLASKVGYIGMYANRSQRARLTKQRVGAVVGALNKCMLKKKRPAPGAGGVAAPAPQRPAPGATSPTPGTIPIGEG